MRANRAVVDARYTPRSESDLAAIVETLDTSVESDDESTTTTQRAAVGAESLDLAETSVSQVGGSNPLIHPSDAPPPLRWSPSHRLSIPRDPPLDHDDRARRSAMGDGYAKQLLGHALDDRPAPSTFLASPSGLRRLATLSLQGLIEDPASWLSLRGASRTPSFATWVSKRRHSAQHR